MAFGVGVDFGGWKTRGAVCRSPAEPNVELIQSSAMKNLVVPSYVEYRDTDITIGKLARPAAVFRPENVIYGEFLCHNLKKSHLKSDN